MTDKRPETQKKRPTLLHAKLIGGVVARGESKRIIEALPPGKIMASEYVSIRNAQSSVAGENWEEMDLLRLIARPEDADGVFAQLHELAEVSTREGVYLYQHDLPRCTEYILPLLPQEGLALSVLKDDEQAGELGLDAEQVEQLKTLAKNE